MIKTPIMFDRELDLVVDSSGKYIFDVFSDDATTLEAVKRINLHEDLVEELTQVKQFLEDMHMMPVEWIMKESQYRHPIVEKLLEKCRE